MTVLVTDPKAARMDDAIDEAALNPLSVAYSTAGLPSVWRSV